MSSQSEEESRPQEQQLELGEDEHAIALRKAWERTLRALAGQFNKPTFDNFLRPLKPLTFDGNVVVLGTPSAFAREWAEKKYSQALQAQLTQFLSHPGLQLRFVVSSPDVQPLLGEKPPILQQAVAPAPRPEPTQAAADEAALADARNPFVQELAAAPLQARYTFDGLIVGKSNRLAHAGALAVAGAPGAIYNPLFLYGNPGLGKTHLMHAIGQRIREERPESRIAYVSGETFTNHFVMALREKKTEEFRRAYRSVDVWLVDDIQTLATGQKEQTKEEFFHTFNTLFQMGRQIVIASDRSPRELRAMDERLRSRFESGLIADVAPPEFEMRMAILQKKALLDNFRIPDEVIAFMANLIQSNIRALEGALIKLMAYASLTHSPVTTDLASDILSSYYVERSPREAPVQEPEERSPQRTPRRRPAPAEPGSADVTVERIVEAVAAEMAVDPDKILAGGLRSGRGNRLRGDAAYARQVAMYLAKERGGAPLSSLAAAFGCKNHAAVAHAHARLRGDLENDPAVIGLLARIQRILGIEEESALSHRV